MSYDCAPHLIVCRPLSDIRTELLQVRVFGNETADSILLYGFDFLTFVVDAYTTRFFRRFPFDVGKDLYGSEELRESEPSPGCGALWSFSCLDCASPRERCKKKWFVEAVR